MTREISPDILTDRSQTTSDPPASKADKQLDTYDANAIKALADYVLRSQVLSAPPPKDNWDRVGAVAPIISGTLIFLMGGFFTYTFNQQQLRLQEIQTIEKFIPHLMGNEQSKKAAILAIKNLTNAELAGKFASIFASSGTVSALHEISETGTAHDKTVAETALAEALRGLQEKDGKLSTLQKAYEDTLSKTNGQTDASALYSLEKLGDTYKLNGRYALAETVLKKALSIKEKVYGADNPEVADALRSLAEVYQLSGKATDADSCLKRAQTIEAKIKFPTDTDGQTNQSPALPSDDPHSKVDGKTDGKSDQRGKTDGKTDVKSDASDKQGSAFAADGRSISAVEEKRNRGDDNHIN